MQWCAKTTHMTTEQLPDLLLLPDAPSDVPSYSFMLHCQREPEVSSQGACYICERQASAR
jgi:hypothetical protein